MNGTYKMWRNEIKKKKKNVVEKIRKKNAIKKESERKNTGQRNHNVAEKVRRKTRGCENEEKELLQWEVSFDRLVVGFI